MNVGQAIEQLRLMVRRDTWFKDADWKALLNNAVMDFSAQTNILEADFELTLGAGLMEYDMSEEQLHTITEDAILNNTTILKRKTREQVVQLAAGNLTTQGAPLYIYNIATYTIGVYPVPDATYEGSKVLLHGRYHPAEITADTPLDTPLPFESVDHPAIVHGALIAAERIDKDLGISQDVYGYYKAAIYAARGRRQSRMPGTARVKRSGR